MCNRLKKDMFRKYVPSEEENEKMEKYRLRVPVFDALKIKYQNGGIDTLKNLKEYLEKHYTRVPLTFFTLYGYLKSVENEPLENVKTWTGTKYVYPLEKEFNKKVKNKSDRTLTLDKIDEILRSNWMDLDNSIRHITNAVEKGYVSEELKTKLQRMYAFVDNNRYKSLSGGHVYSLLQMYRLV